MKFGFRVSSINKLIAARTSVKRFIRQSLGVKAPKGYGWVTDPHRALYNRVYNRTTRGCGTTVLLFGGFVLIVAGVVIHAIKWRFTQITIRQVDL